ncbi:MAG: hypothetical protein HY698_12040 [Deltaproteobacteria bacterium]|nr:hypothetical protein [Deltaproteobacteria bacterium]
MVGVAALALAVVGWVLTSKERRVVREAPVASHSKRVGSPPPGRPSVPGNSLSPSLPPLDRSVAAAREDAIRGRVQAVLRVNSTPASINSVTCDSASCRVEMETPDLDAFRPAWERMQEPGTGFVGEAEFMKLEKPVPLGPQGPYRVAFSLWGQGQPTGKGSKP